MEKKFFRSISIVLFMVLGLTTKQLYSKPEQLCKCIQTRTFGKWSICRKLYNYILEILPEGSTMVEFGSGWTSGELSKHYSVWSVEHNKKWVDKYETNYIYAPIEQGWYSIEALKENLPAQYDLILVDGPPANIGRQKFFDHLNLFNTDVPIIFDDINRKAENKLMEKVSKHLKREAKIVSCGGKKFGILFPEQKKK